MVSDYRIKEYRFGVVISNAGGVLVESTSFPINGEILKMQWDNHDTAAGGSIFLQCATPFAETLGSIVATNADTVIYPSVAQQDFTRTRPVVDDVLRISGGGLGDTKSGAMVLYYR